MSLHPTPTRLRRLREVEQGGTFRYHDGQDYDPQQFRVTAAIGELEWAGWVKLGPKQPVKTPWELTDLGKEVLHGSLSS